MTKSLNNTQKAFVFAILSELGACLRGPNIGLGMKNVLDQELARIAPDMGRWRLVWGPGVFQTNPLGLADNLAFVVHDLSNSRLVLAIAGTNPNSQFDWTVEDWGIGDTVPWTFGEAPEGAVISSGSAIAISIVMNMLAPAGVPGAGTSLPMFLRAFGQEVQEQTRLEVCGHSLGGALAPAVALWAMDNQELWDPNGRFTIGSRSFAGPTTGNAAFASYATKRLGANAHRIANDLDISPMGWRVETLEKAKRIYAPSIPETEVVSQVLELRIAEAASTDYRHVQPDAKLLEGQIDFGIIDPLQSDYVNYHTQSGYQHLEAYFQLLDLPQYSSYQGVMRAALAPLARAAAVSNYVATWTRPQRRAGSSARV